MTLRIPIEDIYTLWNCLGTISISFDFEIDITIDVDKVPDASKLSCYIQNMGGYMEGTYLCLFV